MHERLRSMIREGDRALIRAGLLAKAGRKDEASAAYFRVAFLLRGVSDEAVTLSEKATRITV